MNLNYLLVGWVGVGVSGVLFSISVTCFGSP